jgi:hypothetical protein
MVVSPHTMLIPPPPSVSAETGGSLAKLFWCKITPLHEWEAILVEWGVISMIFPQRCPRHCDRLFASAISIQTGVIARPFAGHQQPRHHSQCRGLDRKDAGYCQEMIAEMEKLKQLLV